MIYVNLCQHRVAEGELELATARQQFDIHVFGFMSYTIEGICMAVVEFNSAVNCSCS